MSTNRVSLDVLSDPTLCHDLEEQLWRPIAAQETVEVLRDYPASLADPPAELRVALRRREVPVR